MNYGRKIIDYIFGKRSDSSSVCYEREQKIQADSDRSDIRMFEIGLSTQRHGDYRQSTRNAEEEECNRLIKIAKENNLYIDKANWEMYGNKRMTPTGESVVFLSKDAKTYTKMKLPFAKAPMKNTQPEDFIYEHLIHNILFPSTRYRFVGISEDAKGIRLDEIVAQGDGAIRQSPRHHSAALCFGHSGDGAECMVIGGKCMILSGFARCNCNAAKVQKRKEHLSKLIDALCVLLGYSDSNQE